MIRFSETPFDRTVTKLIDKGEIDLTPQIMWSTKEGSNIGAFDFTDVKRAGFNINSLKTHFRELASYTSVLPDRLGINFKLYPASWKPQVAGIVVIAKFVIDKSPVVVQFRRFVDVNGKLRSTTVAPIGEDIEISFVDRMAYLRFDDLVRQAAKDVGMPLYDFYTLFKMIRIHKPYIKQIYVYLYKFLVRLLNIKSESTGVNGKFIFKNSFNRHGQLYNYPKKINLNLSKLNSNIDVLMDNLFVEGTLLVKPLGVSKNKFGVLINDFKHFYAPKPGSGMIAKSLESKFRAIAKYSVNKALTWLKENSLLVTESKRGRNAQ